MIGIGFVALLAGYTLAYWGGNLLIGNHIGFACLAFNVGCTNPGSNSGGSNTGSTTGPKFTSPTLPNPSVPGGNTVLPPSPELPNIGRYAH